MKFEITYVGGVFVKRNMPPKFKVKIFKGEGLHEFEVKGKKYHLENIEGLENYIHKLSKKIPKMIIQKGIREFIGKI